jgi:hypothetical protein
MKFRGVLGWENLEHIQEISKKIYTKSIKPPLRQPSLNLEFSSQNQLINIK